MPLWVSPTTSPVRLGVSPAAAPTPTGAFNQRSEALFSRAGALGYLVCFAPRRFSRFICVRIWGHGVLPAALPAPFVPHFATVTRVLSAPPTGLDVCFFFIYLVSDFLAVRFSVSSGCAKRRSVSTYVAILVLSLQLLCSQRCYINQSAKPPL